MNSPTALPILQIVLCYLNCNFLQPLRADHKMVSSPSLPTLARLGAQLLQVHADDLQPDCWVHGCTHFVALFALVHSGPTLFGDFGPQLLGGSE